MIKFEKAVTSMLNFPIEETVKARKSIRTYLDKPLADREREKINAFIDYLACEDSYFGVKIRIKLFDVDKEINSKDLGTYGVIKNAKTYLGVACEKGEDAMEAVGYAFEKLVLYAQSIGLGTCWLGGTFNRGEFAKAMQIEEKEFFPIASPIGYPAAKTHTINKIMRKAIGADSRKAWDKLFFDGDFSKPLTQEAAGDYAYALEMVRLAPSAANKQPWRIVRQGNVWHFFEKKEMSSSENDIQRLDVGIALCHFELAAKEKGLKGELKTFENVDIACEDNMLYIFSWVAE